MTSIALVVGVNTCIVILVITQKWKFNINILIMKQTVEEAAKEARMASAETLTTYGTHTSLDDFTYLSHDEIAEAAFIIRKIIENLSDDYEIEMRVRRKLTDEELKNCRYPYPYDTEYLILEFDDIGVSDKVLCLGVTSNR